MGPVAESGRLRVVIRWIGREWVGMDRVDLVRMGRPPSGDFG